jgi:multidrug efflux pump subunit AcrB
VRKASLCAYFVVRRADALQFSRSSVSFLTRAGRTNRLLVILITGAVGVFGAIAATMLRQELLPSLDVPATQVVVTVPGASPGVVVEEIAMPVEAAGT